MKPKTNKHMMIASSQPSKHKKDAGMSLTKMIGQQLAASKTIYTRVKTNESASKNITPSKATLNQSTEGGISKRLEFIEDETNSLGKIACELVEDSDLNLLFNGANFTGK